MLADATAPYIIAAEELTIKQRIGGGCSGSVHLGKWQETDVAIKVRPEPSPNPMQALQIQTGADDKVSTLRLTCPGNHLHRQRLSTVPCERCTLGCVDRLIGRLQPAMRTISSSNPVTHQSHSRHAAATV